MDPRAVNIIAAVPGFILWNVVGILTNAAGATGSVFASAAGAVVDGITGLGGSLKVATAYIINGEKNFETRNGNKYTIATNSQMVCGSLTFTVETSNGTTYTFIVRAEGKLTLLYFDKKYNGETIETCKMMEYDVFGLNTIDEKSLLVLQDVFEHYEAYKMLYA